MGKDTHIHLRLSTEDKERIQKFCDERLMNMSKFILHAVKKAMNEGEK